MPVRPFATSQFLKRWREVRLPGPDKTWHHQPDASFLFFFFFCWLSLLFCEIMSGGKALRHFSICCFGLGEMRSIKLEMEGEPGSEEMCSGGTKSCRQKREKERERERERETEKDRERDSSPVGQSRWNSWDAKRSTFILQLDLFLTVPSLGWFYHSLPIRISCFLSFLDSFLIHSSFFLSLSFPFSISFTSPLYDEKQMCQGEQWATFSIKKIKKKHT